MLKIIPYANISSAAKILENVLMLKNILVIVWLSILLQRNLKHTIPLIISRNVRLPFELALFQGVTREFVRAVWSASRPAPYMRCGEAAMKQAIDALITPIPIQWGRLP